MSVFNAMATAISGLEANGQALSVISDNIVNANTTAFKGSRTEFQSVLAQDLSSSSASMGRGVQVGGVTTLYTQGALTRTDRGMDCAINGDGFFVVRTNNKATQYTRDGAFRFDKDGWMTTLGGGRVQSYLANEGKLTGKIGDLRIPYSTIPAKPTQKLELHLNLDARTPVNLNAMDLARPDETSQFQASVSVFDSVGNQHAVAVYFNRTSDSQWEWKAMTDGGSLAGGTKGVPTEVAQGNLLFDQQGNLVSQDQSLTNTSFASGALPDQPLFFDFGNIATNNDELNKREVTSMYGSKHSVFRSTQDGWTAGYLTNTQIDGDGFIKGLYTNGETRLMGKLAVARFEAPERLSKSGENQFSETAQSGMPLVGYANTSGRGGVQNQTLEQSNIDLAKEFVDMIKAQRGFQASTKSISVANQMLDEIVNLYRA